MQTDEEKNLAKIRKVLRKKLQAYFKETLEPLGFVNRPRSSLWKRDTQTLLQSCSYGFPRDYYVRISFGYQFVPSFECWNTIPQDSQTQKRFELFRNELTELWQVTRSYLEHKDWDVPATFDEIDNLLDEINVYFTQEILIFLEKYQQSSDLLSEYNAGNIGDKYISDTGEPWFSFKLAFLRYQEGKYAETLELFQKYLLSIEEDRKRDESWEMLASGVELAVDSLKKRLNQNDGN